MRDGGIKTLLTPIGSRCPPRLFVTLMVLNNVLECKGHASDVVPLGHSRVEGPPMMAKLTKEGGNDNVEASICSTESSSPSDRAHPSYLQRSKAP
ncbi:hypothetical protein GUJ93_ZPchr0008g11937 [Zizania palustris]|uniref:Uncharacterized protein n=1 Tax=Zizania palustris TaxID=103762 RepID=A0A8J5RXP2_ZIZPA|nr:hypothetical protein GUJ93_ZPchr0008g11937 [Zizania palustris]